MKLSAVSNQLSAFSPPTVCDLLESQPLAAFFAAKVFADR
jgi:hypothetical protein